MVTMLTPPSLFSCTGVSTWGNFSLTLIDSLDTMVIMGLHDEFRDAVQRVLANSDFNVDKNVGFKPSVQFPYVSRILSFPF